MAVQPAYDLGTIATQRLLRRITSDDEQPVEEIVGARWGFNHPLVRHRTQRLTIALG